MLAAIYSGVHPIFIAASFLAPSIEQPLKLRSQSSVLSHWAMTAKEFLMTNTLDWSLKVALAFEPDPELVYMRLRC